MAKLHFYYASMNAGKSTALLQADFNYRERGMATMLWTAAVDHRPDATPGLDIVSRIGIGAPARRYDRDTDLVAAIMPGAPDLSAVLVDEAQFLTEDQVWQLAWIADEAGIPVLCYGLRTDFRGALFEGAATLLAIADRLVELRGVCHCGAKATMNLRIDPQGHPVRDGAQTEIGGNDRYIALCRRHFRESLG
ncbi:thymidine kinase [Novosphingobium sp. FSW06-99]|uniref:thymidine kinase n=1 Tax=Novosphingobium sp. FSW06-99 TaxID=1739113 RepID=UPI00076D46B0|nr:thymidine kinase [Novosphingobium sp. FSW06-99]KUR80883.1 thymidine kinase [Novosphingobium sp. FSW06-99]